MLAARHSELNARRRLRSTLPIHSDDVVVGPFVVFHLRCFQ
jgi:hypothetical protein